MMQYRNEYCNDPSQRLTITPIQHHQGQAI